MIHPFREGNGRMSRLLCDVLSALAGKGLLDNSLWVEHKGLLQSNTSSCIRELQPYDATDGRNLVRLTGEANSFRLCLVVLKLLRNFLYRYTGFFRGCAGNGTIDLSSGNLSM